MEKVSAVNFTGEDLELLLRVKASMEKKYGKTSVKAVMRRAIRVLARTEGIKDEEAKVGENNS